MGVARLCPVALICLLPGCFWVTTKYEGDVLRKDVKSLSARTTTIEKGMQEKLAQLDSSLEQAKKILTRNSADLVTNVESLADQTAKLTAQVETLRRENDALRADLARQRQEFEARVAETEQRVVALEKAASAKPVASQPVIERDPLYEGAKAKLDGGQFSDARKDFRLFIQKFPEDPRVPAAQYWVGEAFYRERQYDKAIAEFQRLIDTYAKSEMVDDAFYEAGMAALDMKGCVEAAAYFGELVRRFPDSTLAKNAKAKITLIGKSKKNKDVCQQ
jgi:tol-pal system protein YbgF